MSAASFCQEQVSGLFPLWLPASPGIFPGKFAHCLKPSVAECQPDPV